MKFNTYRYLYGGICILVLFVGIFYFFLKEPITNFYAKKIISKTINKKWKQLFLGFQNGPWIEYNEEINNLKSIIKKSFKFDSPEKKFDNVFKAKIICDDNTILFLKFSPYAWSIANKKNAYGTMYKVLMDKKDYRRLFYITSVTAPPISIHPELPVDLPDEAKKSLNLFFKNLDSQSPINEKRLAGYFNFLKKSPFKSNEEAIIKSKYLVQNKNKLSYNDFLIYIGAID